MVVLAAPAPDRRWGNVRPVLTSVALGLCACGSVEELQRGSPASPGGAAGSTSSTWPSTSGGTGGRGSGSGGESAVPPLDPRPVCGVLCPIADDLRKSGDDVCPADCPTECALLLSAFPVTCTEAFAALTECFARATDLECDSGFVLRSDSCKVQILALVPCASTTLGGGGIPGVGGLPGIGGTSGTGGVRTGGTGGA